MLKYFKFGKKSEKGEKPVGPFFDFALIPQDILFAILRWIDDNKTLANCQRVSKQWNQVISSDPFWQQRCIDYEYDLNLLEQQFADSSWRNRWIAVQKDADLRIKVLYGDYFEDSSEIIWNRDSFPDALPFPKQATPEFIIAHLYHPKVNDERFRSAVLTLLPSVFHDNSFLELTISFYKKTSDLRTRQRVHQVLIIWLSEFRPRQFESDFTAAFESFIENEIPEPTKSQLQELLSKNESEKDLEPIGTPSNVNMSLFDIPLPHLARQISILDKHIYQHIKFWEFQELAWAKPNRTELSPNIIRTITNFNRLLSYIVEEILQTTELPKRIALVTKVIQLADELIKCHNTQSAMAVVSSLSVASVHRLRKTKEGLSSKIRNKLETLVDQMGTSRNFKTLREMIESQSGGVPYLGMYLTDLTFICDGNPRMYGTKLNLWMIQTQYQVIAQFLKHCEVSYDFERDGQVLGFLESILSSPNRMTEAQCYEASLKLEPRSQN